jgi:glycerol uptake operon antiterminator
MKDFDYLLQSQYEYLILLQSHVASLKSLVENASKHGKKLILHVDLIEGLKADEYGTEFLAQEVKPGGVITTRNNVIVAAKKKGIIAIQRLFLLDTMALENSYTQVEKSKPDYIEVLPGVIPRMIQEILQRTHTPIIAGGLIQSKEDVQVALKAGASMISTSKRELWKMKF